MDENDVRINRRETAYQGYLRIETYHLTHQRFAGGWIPELRREVLRRGAAVAVLLYDPDRDAVVLIEQFRIGAYVNGRPPWVTEIVAGLIETGEDPADVARRETREEAGCDILDLVQMYSYLVSPGCMDETVTIFCGRVDSAGLGGHFGLPEEGEDIRVVVRPFELAWDDLNAGRLDNSIAVIAMLWLKINRDDLRRRWSTPPAAANPGGR
jgi:ADP-ribose pyrophosphatase